MSWLFSQALVEAYSEGTSLAGKPSAQLSLISSPQPFLRSGKMTELSNHFRFGLTLGHLMAGPGEELLTSFRAASPAKISASPVKVPVSTARDQDSGEKWRELSAKFDRDTCSWKTHRLLFDEDLPESSVILPQWGMMRAGVLSERPMPGLHILENESGSLQPMKPSALVPTPTASRGGYYKCRGMKIQKLEGWVKMYPTPTAPRAHDSDQTAGKYYPSKKQFDLAAAVVMFATPTAQDSKCNGTISQQQRNAKALNAQIGGSLNPTWVAWLMGWPIEWVNFEPLATDKFQQWCASHGVS